MFVMSVTTMVVMNSVIVLNVSLRTPNTHIMTDRVRKVTTHNGKCIIKMVFCNVFVWLRLHSLQVLLKILPRTLRMQMRTWTPTIDNFSETGTRKAPAIDRNGVFLAPCRRRSSMTFIHKAEEYMMKTARSELLFNKLKERNGLMKSILEKMRKDQKWFITQSGFTQRNSTSSGLRLWWHLLIHVIFLECEIIDAVAAHGWI